MTARTGRAQTGHWPSKVIQHLAHLIATVSPGAKLGSTAPYTYADLMLIEAGVRQPRSLANAYRNPARPQVEDATQRLCRHLGKLDDAYGVTEARRSMSVEEVRTPQHATTELGRSGFMGRRCGP